MKKYKKTFKSDPDLLPDIQNYIISIIYPLDISDKIKNNIELVVAEAAFNSIIHGNRSDSSKKVEVCCKITKNQICISFTDEGNGFKPENVPDPTIPANILKGSGRGLHIMKNLVDDIEYKFSDKGTELILTFKI